MHFLSQHKINIANIYSLRETKTKQAAISGRV